jgi:hypothetical protein
MKYIWNFQDENMKKSGASQGQSASELISKRIVELGDWRGKTLSRMRKLIKEAEPDAVEEWQWIMGAACLRLRLVAPQNFIRTNSLVVSNAWR